MITLESLQSILVGHLGFALLASFAAGVLTSLSPCIIAMMPLVLGYVGVSGSIKTRRSLFLVLSLVLGLSTAFTALGLMAALLGGIIGITSNIAPVLLGVVLLVMGLSLMQLIHLPAKSIAKMPVRAHGFFGAFLVGLAFGLAASPCAGPVLGIIVGVAAASGRIFTGGLLLFAFGLGQGVPLLVVGSVAGALRTWRGLSRYWDFGAYVAGLLFVGVGLYLIFRSL
ncbi:MAG: Thiol:disulfide interchange protein DsbD [Firmicutes bacterium]|nr:Thiol:disulfide interchange protein DsbD [candidate division NPL-UPA2 bacterium]